MVYKILFSVCLALSTVLFCIHGEARAELVAGCDTLAICASNLACNTTGGNKECATIDPSKPNCLCDIINSFCYCT